MAGYIHVIGFVAGSADVSNGQIVSKGCILRGILIGSVRQCVFQTLSNERLMDIDLKIQVQRNEPRDRGRWMEAGRGQSL